ncbi:MAG TPA: tripartite tricarboxylate transporter substrate binding protein [Burkholderiales bacterium]|nr:tripartite tricarboxylate transporter substrate binding protein [Burkholderiales bacterium]
MKTVVQIAAALAVAVSTPAAAASASASSGYPQRSVRLVVPYPPGGTADLMGRIMGQRLGDAWRSNVVIDNRGGAGGNIATELVARAEPDGYTLLLCNAPVLAINPTLYRKVAFDPVKDFVPVIGIADVPLFLLVHPSVPVKTYDEFLPYVRSRKGNINYASGSVGSTTHLSMELFKTMAKVQLTHVPYKGSGPALAAISAGEVPIMFELMPSAMPFVKSERLRALAVTSAKRFPLTPNLPTVAEKGLPGYDVASWFGLCAPKQTPAAVVKKISDDGTAILKSNEMRDRLATLGAQPMDMPSGKFEAYVKSEISKWSKVVRDSGARVD